MLVLWDKEEETRETEKRVGETRTKKRTNKGDEGSSNMKVFSRVCTVCLLRNLHACHAKNEGWGKERRLEEKERGRRKVQEEKGGR